MSLRIGFLGSICCLLAAVLLFACSGYSPPGPTTAPGSPTAGAKAGAASGGVTIDLVASNVAFNLKEISVPAGSVVTVNFNNKDSGMAHNFAVYQKVANGQTSPVFVGATITGPATTTYQFTAPSATGNYFFECDVHPSQMNGKFSVTPPVG